MANHDSGVRFDSGATYDAVSPPIPRKAFMAAQVKLGLDALNAVDTIALANAIVTAMTGNPNFTTPNPALAALTTQKTTTQTKINTYDSMLASLATALADRDVEIANLRSLLTQLGAYVENVSGGDAVKIASAGMGVRSPRTPVGPMPRVLDLLLSEGDHVGFLDAMWKPIYGARSYEVQISADPMSESTWTFKMSSTKSSATLTGLTSGSKVWVRVRAIGADPLPGDWSDPAMKVVP